MKRLMKLLFFVSVFMFFLAFNASAQTCSDNERILRISGNTNAHGEIYNGAGSYGTEICFTQLFPGYTIGANPHDCIISSPGARPSNLVLRLSANTNAHAQAPDYSGTAYSTDVCYGDLTCVSRNSACPAGQVEIVSLSGNNNAHVETANSNNYNTRICCSASTAPQLIDAKWRYYDGSEIPQGTNVCANNYLIASVTTRGLANGQIVHFSFFDDDSLSPDPLMVSVPANVINNQVNLPLDLSNSAVQAAIQNELGGAEGQDLEIYFSATSQVIPGSLVTSNIINYQSDSNLCAFSDPRVDIVSPVHRGIYFANVEMDFVSGCSSPIGPVENEWTVTQNGNSFTNTEAVFSHTFTDAGQVNVKLKCTDLNDKFGVVEKQILLVSNRQVLAYINDPGFNEFVYTTPLSGPYFPRNVDFSASESFAVDVSGCNVICLGGLCPVETENSPVSCSGNPITITQTTNNYNDLRFDWRFWDDDWSDDWTSSEGNGVYQGTANYDDLSNSLNDKHMRVSITHNPTGANAMFEREFTLGRCLNNGNTYYSSLYESQSTNQENNACKGGDNRAGTADDCCPSGNLCLPGVDNPQLYSCRPSAGGQIECEDFTSQASCNNNHDPSIPLASYGSNPPACTFLQCYWSTSSNSCGVRATQYPSSGTGSCNTGSNPLSDCAYTTSTSECINGRKTITYTPTLNPATCSRAPVTVPCGSLSFELGFFGAKQFFVTLFMIGAIYLIMNLYRVRKNGK